MSVLKYNREGDLKNIPHENLIFVRNRIRKERVKLWMGKPKGLLQVLRERRFMDKPEDEFKHYKLCIQEDNCGSFLTTSVAPCCYYGVYIGGFGC